MKLIVKTIAGLEESLAAELHSFQAQKVVILKRAVSCEGEKELIYKINFRSRLALRVLIEFNQFTASDDRMLYKKVREFDWSSYLDVDKTFAVNSTVHSKFFTHSHYVSLKVKDAIVDQFRDKSGKRPSVDVENPDLLLHLHISENKCSLSLDSSGGGLQKRGYRKRQLEAPLSEVLAAGLISLTGWDGKSTFIDPMCGSGTFAIEAALYAMRIPPGSFNPEFGFMKWKDFDKKLWENVKINALSEQKTECPPIIAADNSEKAIAVSAYNIKKAGLTDMIELIHKPLARLEKPAEEGIIIMNPPYGKRILKEQIISFYKHIGDTLKNNFSGYDAWIFSGNPEALKRVGLRTSVKNTLYNGPLMCKFHKYQLYQGSMKKS